MSNEKPILFKDEMIRAILEGRKTQTRRIVPEWQRPSLTHDGDQYISIAQRHPRWGFGVFGKTEDECMANYNDEYASLCPFGKPGDRLWVRETFQGPLLSYEQAQEFFNHREKFESPRYCQYRADGGPAPVFVNADDEERYGWRPSIHMPRWASRITLEITDVRAERLQEITLGDICKEGLASSIYDFKPVQAGFLAFEELWDSIYGPDSWGANPWVWVIEFKRIDQEAKAA